MYAPVINTISTITILEIKTQTHKQIIFVFNAFLNVLPSSLRFSLVSRLSPSCTSCKMTNSALPKKRKEWVLDIVFVHTNWCLQYANTAVQPHITFYEINMVGVLSHFSVKGELRGLTLLRNVKHITAGGTGCDDKKSESKHVK